MGLVVAGMTIGGQLPLEGQTSCGGKGDRAGFFRLFELRGGLVEIGAQRAFT